jgi:ATP-dependent helicase/nuclease subunit B
MAAGRQPQLFTIPSGIPFARALCAGIIERAGDGPLALADTLVLVPTRRATRALREAFAAALEGAALLPRIVALADVDEEADGPDPAGSLEDLPAIAPLRRRLLLANLVRQWGATRGTPMGLHQALNSAAELADFLDQAITQGADLSRLTELAPTDLAAHWSEVVSFLSIVAVQWPKLLESENATEAAANRDRNLLALARKLAAAPPNSPVIAAGSTGSIPATAQLLKTIAYLPAGAVVLPGLDMDLDEEAWKAVDPTHPQYGLNRLLAHIGVMRDQVSLWSPLPEFWPERTLRVRFLSEALRPSPATDAWRNFVETSRGQAADALKNLSLVEARNTREEAVVIACAMREALETPGRTAALVTPDRDLARRVAAELQRWDIAIDDSAGTPLVTTRPGTFLALLAHAAAERFAPIALLALLKHPLASGGEDSGPFRRKVRELERHALRGLRPNAGLGGIAHRLNAEKVPVAVRDWFANLSRMLSPFAAVIEQTDADLGKVAQSHAAAAEALAATMTASGAARLWRGAAGEAAAGLLCEITRDGAGTTLHPASHYAEIWSELARARAVRNPYNLHPRLSILGPLEARLLDFDLVILGGLNEGKWPAQTTSDPWLSRPMRRTLGLESPERRIGLAAHDFASLTASPTVLLTRSQKENGSPAMASRWLLRLSQLALGLNAKHLLDTRSRLVNWAGKLDSAEPVPRAPRPAPTPPAAVRPRSLSVTEIETWIRDPYAIYAKHILRLRRLDPLDQEPGPAERGIAIHRALECFLSRYPDSLATDAIDELLRLGREEFARSGADSPVLALWMPRFERAARWFVGFERDRRKKIKRSIIEISGVMPVAGSLGFQLRGRADRIDFVGPGQASILDYKTGRVPSRNQLESLLAPQLPLEGAMLLAGAFGETGASRLAEFLHVQLTGGDPPGREFMAKLDANELAGKARRLLEQMVARYENPAEPYRSRVAPFRVREAGDYDHLSRVREWWDSEESDS